MPPFSIHQATSLDQITSVIALFENYAAALGIDLNFQDFAAEIEDMPGKYAPPNGLLLLAYNSTDDPIGCVGLRPTPTPGYCEMKRLYVDLKGRGLGLGKALAEKAIEEVVRMSYKAIRLDTLEEMTSARRLYGQLGFREIEAYYDTPIKDTKFLELRL